MSPDSCDVKLKMTDVFDIVLVVSQFCANLRMVSDFANCCLLRIIGVSDH